MLSHIPIWVFFLFGGLFVLGLWLGRPRAVSPRLQIIVAVGFLGYSLWGVISAFGIHPAACCCGRPESWPVSPSCAGPSVPEGWPEAKFPPGFRFQAAGHPWHLSWACSSVASSSASPRVRVFPLVHMLSSGPQCRFFLARYPEALRRAPSRSRALQQGRTARSNHSVKPTCLRHAAYLKR